MKTSTVNPERLLSLRGKRSREVVAHELRKRGHGTDAKAIWRYETGRNQPSARVLPDYAAVLGVPMDDLYGDADDAEAASMPLSGDPRDMLAVLAHALNQAIEALPARA